MTDGELKLLTAALVVLALSTLAWGYRREDRRK